METATDNVKTISTGGTVYNPFFQFFPEDRQSYFVTLGQVDSEIRFTVGDEANQFYEDCRRAGLPITKRQVYAGLAALVGKSARTVRSWAEVAAFYPPEVRQEFYPPLWFSHFVFAMTHRFIWREVLETSLRLVDQNFGRPVSVDYLAAHFSGRIQNEYREELDRLRADDSPGAVVEESVVIYEMTTASETLLTASGGPETGGTGEGDPVTLPGDFSVSLVSRRVLEAIKFILRALPALGVDLEDEDAAALDRIIGRITEAGRT